MKGTTMKFGTKHIVKAAAVSAVVGVLAFALAGCGTSASSDSNSAATGADDKTIVVGASPSPHAEILEQVKGVLTAEGYTLEVKEFSDYVTPNQALSAGEIDANYFQHQPYLDNYNAENGTDLVGAAAIHFEAMGVYAGKTKSLSAISDGATIAVPSDATNEARALLLLQDQGILKLASTAGLEATVNDIVENPYNVKFVEAEAASLPRLLEDCDFAVINGNYALSSGLTSADVLAFESAASKAADTYGNVIAVRAEDAASDKTKALVAALQSDSVREFIASTYQGTVVAVF